MSTEAHGSWAMAYLSVQVPRRVNELYAPRQAPVVIEAIGLGLRFQASANGRFTAIPAGLVYVTAKPRNAAPVTVAVLLKAGEYKSYSFSSQLFAQVPTKAFAVTKVSEPLSGRNGLCFIRFLEGPRFQPTQLTYVISSAPDGGLTIRFRGEPVLPLTAELVAVRRYRTLLALSPKPGPGKSYTSVKLELEAQKSTVILTTSDIEPQLASAWRSSMAGNYSEALELIEPYLRRYLGQQSLEPTAVAGVAYILIRAGAWDYLGKLIQRLLTGNRLSADSLVIAAEWFGNAGCHLTAINLLKQLPRTGFPIFTDGYSLATARLSAYAEMQSVDDGASGRREVKVYGQSIIPPKPGKALFPESWRDGQKTMSWNCREAREAHEYLRRSVAALDWSSYVLRRSVPRSHLGKLIGSVCDWLSTRLLTEWTAIRWKILIENCAPGKAKI